MDAGRRPRAQAGSSINLPHRRVRGVQRLPLRGSKAAPRGNAALFGASAPSTFCVRPNDVPLSRLQDTKVRQPDNYRNSRDIRGYAKGEVFKLG